MTLRVVNGMTPAAKVIYIYATLLSVLLHVQTYVMLRYCTFSGTCTHTHIMLFYCTFACTQTCDLLPAHTNKGWGWVGWGNNVHLCAHRSCYAEDVLVSVTSCVG